MKSLSLVSILFLVSVYMFSSLKLFSTLSAATTMTLRSLDFEVFGRVQGVFFRKFTKKEADKLGLRGWCKNTAQGSVLGHIQGPSEKVESMMHWLRTTGSPSSQIDEAVFKNQQDISDYTFDDFSIRKD